MVRQSVESMMVLAGVQTDRKLELVTVLLKLEAAEAVATS